MSLSDYSAAHDPSSSQHHPCIIRGWWVPKRQSLVCSYTKFPFCWGIWRQAKNVCTGPILLCSVCRKRHPAIFANCPYNSIRHPLNKTSDKCAFRLTSTTGWWRPGLTQVVGEGVRNTANDVKYLWNIVQMYLQCKKKQLQSTKILSKSNKNQPEGCSLQTAQFAIKIAITILTSSYRI